MLLQNNVHPHSATHSGEALKELNFKVLERPPYIVFTSSDCHLFRPLTEVIRSRLFVIVQEVMEAVHQWLSCQSKENIPKGYKEARS